MLPRIVTVILILLCFSVGAARAEGSVFTTTLSSGSSGSQVKALQQLLNKDASTRVATSGPGSPGQETGRFGALTKAAVIRFQEKYAVAVLAPAGLTRSTGVVGALTRAKLNSLSYPNTIVASAPKPTPPATTTPLFTRPNSNSPAVGSDVDVVNKLVKKINMLGTAQKIPPETLALIEQKIRSAPFASTTQFREKFFDDQRRASAASRSNAGLGHSNCQQH